MAGRVVITGLGMITPVGSNVEETWEAVLAARSGVRPITRFDATGFPVTFAAEVDADGEVPTMHNKDHRLFISRS